MKEKYGAYCLRTTKEAAKCSAAMQETLIGVFSLLEMLELHLCLLFCEFNSDVHILVCLDDGSHVRHLEDHICYRIKLEQQVVLTAEVTRDSHSRKGIMDMRPLSLALPVHFGKMIAFSGLGVTCSGWVSSKTTLDRSRLRYLRSLTG